jgi:hypothetical protein
MNIVIRRQRPTLEVRQTSGHSPNPAPLPADWQTRQPTPDAWEENLQRMLNGLASARGLPAGSASIPSRPEEPTYIHAGIPHNL